MGNSTLCFLISFALLAYYIYTPLPDNIEETWKLTVICNSFKIMHYLATSTEMLGLAHYMDVIYTITNQGNVGPISDENVTVTDTTFNGIPVRLYVPKRKSDKLKRGVFHIHGGGWCVGDKAMNDYDLFSRWTANRLDAVVVSTNYRLAPKYHFPVQFEDVYTAVRWFLQRQILEKYGVDPSRICISGDSAGGNLAAAVNQQLLDDPDVKIKIKIQSLLYPALQSLDMDLPSYRENKHMLILQKSLMVRFWSEYFTTDRALEEAMISSRHVPVESSHLFKFVNWSALLPEKFKKGHVYANPIPGTSDLAKKYPGYLDVRAAPLLTADTRLRRLPLTYIMTCQHDVLRDDGLMYVSRLRQAGVQVVHEHVEDGFHGILSFLSFPTALNVGLRVGNEYISWLKENL
ncbi:arylacetamide deacetylase-like [Tachyglossus aculeatus]|uniref:arylacetamide deacetylase-like n=1 Tax=Tachyglossus aculeatus TaxID=9261 RepID=UPI0018F32503|nr:arylacetamide deacetylase-like [Tachyglossus aculeatus]